MKEAFPVVEAEPELPRPVSFCQRGQDCTYHEVKHKNNIKIIMNNYNYQNVWQVIFTKHYNKGQWDEVVPLLVTPVNEERGCSLCGDVLPFRRNLQEKRVVLAHLFKNCKNFTR